MPRTVQRAHKLRLYPTAEQRRQLDVYFGAARWVWNRALEFRSKAYRRRGESVTGTDFSRLLTRLKQTSRYGWLRETPATVLTQKLRDQDQAFANFFADRAGYPKFRKRRRRGSGRYRAQQQRIARLHAKVADARANFLHQVSRRIVDENQVLVTETLNVRGMMRNRCLARAIADAGWGELRRQIAYKAQWAQRTHIEVDPWFPSTRRCSGCHALHAGLTLADRHWRCEACGAEHDRDVNAACNLEQEGLRLLTGQRPAGPGRLTRVEGKTPGPPPARSGSGSVPDETRTDSTGLRRYEAAEAA